MTRKPVLLIDAEHNETFLIDNALDAGPRRESILTMPRHWGWVDVERKVTLNGVRFVVKQSIRYSYWSRESNYRWYKRYSPVTISFGLWDQAEARHKNDKLVPKAVDELQDRKARRVVRDILWGLTNGAAIDKNKMKG